MSGNEQRRRAEAKAKEELDQQETEHKKKPQIVMDSYTVDANGNFIPRESGAHEITGAGSCVDGAGADGRARRCRQRR